MIESHDSNATVYFILRKGKWPQSQIKAIDQRNARLGGVIVKAVRFGEQTIHGVRYLTAQDTVKNPQGDINEEWALSAIHHGELYEFHSDVTISSNPNSDLQQQQAQQALAGVLLD